MNNIFVLIPKKKPLYALLIDSPYILFSRFEFF